ncbi:hypothetical protein JG687_00004471 [Phytophthora cactorum]|uniref:Uncharacterized protein n=1 Tax=Phytophthora cactorum TaxID=29920 RepID=A0A8T1UT78_9STRA|nr:hypothetical protein JG687_00004471 [Phytophthora cactorum]
MVKAAELLGVPDMSCVAHSLHLVVAGTLTKGKTNSSDCQLPAWTDDVETIPENEEDELLSRDDRTAMASLRDLAIIDMDAYLNETIPSLQRNEMDVVRVIVQFFRTLVVDFKKSAKAHNRLGAIQVRDYRIKSSGVVNLQVACPTRWSSCLRCSSGLST